MADIELVIKIDEDSYKVTCNESMLPPDVKNVVNAIKNGTPLPKNATNGDVIKALFPNEPDFRSDFDEDWWNAPYKVESEEV